MKIQQRGATVKGAKSAANGAVPHTVAVPTYTTQTQTDARLIDLFAGVGGFRLAFESLGARCVFSSEWDKYAQQTYAENFGETPAGDITQVDVADVPAHDVLTAGFPCQPFSIAGVSKNNALGRAHGFEHETQGTLFFDVCRLIAHHRPRAFLLENVRNLVSHDQGRTFPIIIDALEKKLNYHVRAQIIDARRLVPQHRQRIYIVGFRDPTDFQFPLIPDLRPRLRDILEPDVSARYTLSDHLWQYLQNYAAKHKAAGNGFGFGLADFDGVTRTLSARYYKDGSEILIPQEGCNPRRLTPRECARLMGFPDSFKIPVSDTRAYKQFGNSVAVPVVRLIAQEMLQCLNRQKSRDSDQLKLKIELPLKTPRSPRLPLLELENGSEAGRAPIRARLRGARRVTSGRA